MVILMVYLSYFGPAVNWGDVSNELIFHQVNALLIRHLTSSATMVCTSP